MTAGSVSFTATFNDSETANRLWDALPLRAGASVWGDEIYFGTPVSVPEAPDAQASVELGAVAYWPPGQALCFFFGPTPASRGGDIRPASPANVLGHIEGDPRRLKAVPPGAPIVVEKG